MAEQLSIIIPVYNEGKNIGKLLDGISANVKHIESKIYIVYDFEKDDTLPVIKRISSKYEFQIMPVLNKFPNGGVLNAIKTGLSKASGKAVLITMADNSDDPKDIPKMYTLISKGYDVVCASRYTSGGKTDNQDVVKKSLSEFIGVSLHRITGIPTTDVTNNFKMYSKRAIKNITIESNGGFELAMEITVKAYVKGYKITEIPTTWRDRTAGKSRFKLAAWAPYYFHWYVYAITHTYFS